MQKKWYRSRNDRMIGGVAGGIAVYFEIDPVIVRIIFTFAVILGGSGVLAYILLWIIIPEEPFTIENDSSINNSTTSDKTSNSKYTDTNNEPKANGKNDNKRTSYIFGGILIVLGFILLINNFFTFEAFWPLIFIALGVALLFKSKKN